MPKRTTRRGPRNVIHARPIGPLNAAIADVLVVPDRLTHYAFIDRLDLEKQGRRLVALHIGLEGLTTAWFHQYYDANQPLPAIDTIATAAGMFVTDLSIAADQMHARSAIAGVHNFLYEGNWIELDIVPNDPDQRYIGVDAYLPAGNGSHPAALGMDPDHAQRVYITRIRRIPNNQVRIALLQQFYGGL